MPWYLGAFVTNNKKKRKGSPEKLFCRKINIFLFVLFCKNNEQSAHVQADCSLFYCLREFV